MKRAGNAPVLQKSPCMDVKSFLHKKLFFVYTDDDKLEMTMPKQIDVKVTKPQNKHGNGRTRKWPIKVPLQDEYIQGKQCPSSNGVITMK